MAAMHGTGNLFSHPEIESRSLLPRGNRVLKKSDHSTSLDLLEVYPDRIVWKEQLGHAQLIDHFRGKEPEDASDPNVPHMLRIFFIDDLNFDIEPAGSTTLTHDTSSTATWFQQRFSVSPLFLECVKNPRNGVTIGSGSFVRREAHGRCLALDGLYRYSPDLAAPDGPPRPPVHVWFSHNLITGQGATYLIHKCPSDTKQIILSCAQGPNSRSLLKPLAIDIFLGEDCVQRWAERVAETRMNLLKYEGPLPKELDHETTARSVEDLYQLSQLFQIIRDIVTDVRDELDFLVTVFELREQKSPSQNPDDGTVAESLRFVKSKNQILMRWVINYTERTQVQINRFFNHATQKDNAVNVSISQLTSKIAVSAQKDSSAMITMAAVTMAFLPGSFISALFSTVFFDSAANAEGKDILLVHPQWWIFPTVTVPLTIIVFLTWILWWRVRAKMNMVEIPEGTSIQTRLEKIDVHTQRVDESATSEKVAYSYAMMNSSGATPRSVHGHRFQ